MGNTITNEEMRAFLIGELRAIRPSLPAEWHLRALYQADLNLDSLDLVELVARIEQRYGLLVPDADLPEFISLDATLRYIAGRIE